jgi:hypothetical protein
MGLVEQIIAVYDELEFKDFRPDEGSITVSDDGDGIQYIAKWDYSKPIPEGLTLGKPSA